jgi:uncharacterized protein (TIGR03437 family)
MKRIFSFLISYLLIPTAVLAQSTSILIGTNATTPNRPIFLVDGTIYTTTQVFVWPVGSKHTVQFPFSLDNNGNQLNYQIVDNGQIEWTFGGWTASNGNFIGGSNSIVTLTADPSLTSFIASVTALYQVNISFGNSSTPGACSGAPGEPSNNATGVMYLDGTCYDSSAQLYLPAGSHLLNEFPFPGSVFYGYLAPGLIQTPINSINIAYPMTITPLWSQAKRVIFMTNPPGLQVLVDGQPLSTPTTPSSTYTGGCVSGNALIPPGAPPGFPALCLGEADFLPGSTHHIGATSPQMVTGQQGFWVFEQYTNGMTQNSAYVAPQNVSVWDTLTADFSPAIPVTFYTTPLGLKLMIDGRDNWPSYKFLWGQGETHQVVAESPQTDAKGRVWSFSTWSDGGNQSHAITVPTGVTGMTLNAAYSGLDQITVTSNPPGLNFSIDGNGCTTPCVVNKADGSTSQVSIPSSVPNGQGSRYDFTAWSDGSTATTRTINYSQGTATLSANYQTSYQLTAAANPAKGGSFQFSPTSPDGFYASGTQVTVTAVPAAGYKFVEWSGALAGTVNPSVIPMVTPLGIVANYLAVPYIPPAGIESATGPTADGTVAAGSLISIYGQDLAPAVAIGPSNPLAQAIGGTTVTVGQYILPLVFVSPTLINAQVPWELQPGTYSLAVHNTGQPDVAAQFTVSSISPGAFTQPNAQQQPLVLALHADGTPVTFDSPAIHGEQITIYGTGFGPYDQPSVDGFPAAAGQTFNLLNPMMLNTDAAGPVQPDWAGAASGMVGVAVVQLTIGNEFPPATNVNLTISVNGKNSTSLVLPLQ